MGIQFNNDVQEKVHSNIMKWGQELFGEMLSLDEDGYFGITFGSAQVYLSVRPWGDDECIINMWSIVITEAELTSDLMKFLLKENHKMPFGVFSISSSSGNIQLVENVVGSSCTKDELRLSLHMLGRMVDDYDDQIKSTWGGSRAVDR